MMGKSVWLLFPLFILFIFTIGCTSSKRSSRGSGDGLSISPGDSCEGQEKPDHASWKLDKSGDPIVVSSDGGSVCQWKCDLGYKANSDGNGCVIKEEVTAFSVANLVTHPTHSTQKGIKTRSLTLSLTATDVSHWAVTTDSRFQPKSITDPVSAHLPAGTTWNAGNPGASENYNLDAGVAEGPVTLYLWVADENGDVKRGVRESEPFTLDLTAPVITSVASPPGNKLVAGESSAPFNLTVTGITGPEAKYEYCFGTGCSNFTTASGVPAPTLFL